MEDVLKVNLNELVSERVSKQIKHLKSMLKRLNNQIDLLSSKNIDLQKKLNKFEKSSFIIDTIQDSFSKIVATGNYSSSDYSSKQKNQYLFISKILLDFFGITQEQDGWYCFNGDGNLKTHLAVNYYHNKELVINLLKLLINDFDGISSFISTFKMPYDYDKQRVLEYVHEPRYNTNGAAFGISKYWIESGASSVNVPHDLIMQSPYIVEPDVFDELIDTIKKNRGQYYRLFAITKYNKLLSDDQIMRIGKCLLALDIKMIRGYDDVGDFIKQNIMKFDDETNDFLFKLISSDNHFRTLDWTNFPPKYQMKYLNSMPIKDVLKTITHYSCNWTDEEKMSFLKEYAGSKNEN